MAAFFLVYGLEQRRAKRRRQYQRHHDRQRHGGHDGDGELAISTCSCWCLARCVLLLRRAKPGVRRASRPRRSYCRLPQPCRGSCRNAPRQSDLLQPACEVLDIVQILAGGAGDQIFLSPSVVARPGTERRCDRRLRPVSPGQCCNCESPMSTASPHHVLAQLGCGERTLVGRWQFATIAGTSWRIMGILRILSELVAARFNDAVAYRRSRACGGCVSLPRTRDMPTSMFLSFGVIDDFRIAGFGQRRPSFPFPRLRF